MTRPDANRRRLTCHLPGRPLAARKFATLGRLAPGIAHEINTPTQYIGDNLCFLRDAFDQLIALLPPEAVTCAGSDIAFVVDEIPSALAQSLDGITQVGQVVAALRRFAAAPVEHVELLDLNQTVESVLTIARTEWKYVADVVRELDPTLPLVPCVPGALQQVILLLVTGAARAVRAAATAADPSRGAGVITVRTRRDGCWVELSIVDDAAAVAIVPARRVRALTFARAVVVEAHGGTLRVESATERSTTVVIRLPLPEDTGAQTVLG